MTIDSAIPRSRRALLTAGLAAGAAAVASAVTLPLPVKATNGGSVILGQDNDATAMTRIASSTAFAVFQGEASGSSTIGVLGAAYDGASTGVWGQSSTTGGYGVYAYASAATGTNYGVFARTDSDGGVGLFGWADAATGSTRGVLGQASSPGGTGVQGYSGTGGWPEPSPKTGVHGYAAQDSAAIGVKGESPAGTGVHARSTTGTALSIDGKTHSSRSGKATVLAGHRSVDVTVPGGLSGTPLCFANLRIYRSGVAVAAVRPNYPSSGKIRIYLTKVMTSSTAVSWMVMD